MMSAFVLVVALSLPLVQEPHESGSLPEVESCQVEVMGERLLLRSDLLSESRTLRVHVPAAYATTDSRYPLLLVFDGEVHFEHVAASAAFLAAQAAIPELIVVAIHNTDREADFTPADLELPGVPIRRAERFADFLEQELVPFLEKRYRTAPLRIGLGHSHGGLFVTWALAARPSLIDWAIVLDGPAHHREGWIARRLIGQLAEDADRRGSLLCIDRSFGWREEDWRLLESTAPVTFPVWRSKLPSESHQSLALPGSYEALRKAFQDFAPSFEPGTSLEEIERAYRLLSARYGYEVLVPMPRLLEAIDDLIWAGRSAPALELIERVRGRQESHQLDWLESRAREVLEVGPPRESVDALLALEPPSERDIEEYLGRWRGVIEAPTPITVELELSLDQGRVVGTLTTLAVGGLPVEREPEPLVLLRRLGDGSVQWGVMNGKRPRAIVGTRVWAVGSDRLEGEQEMLGVVLPPRLRSQVRPTPVWMERQPDK
ncbi:MAG: alpha/beta hydrolase-fold protein [Planctomycetota bacterium]